MSLHDREPIHVVVDGMNVIGSRPDGWWRDRPGAMRDLVTRLEAYSAATGEAVTVVLEGRPLELQGDGRVRVAFASRSGPDAADDEIVALVSSAEEPSRLRVVTSDAGLAARVRELGAETVGAGAFRRRLDRLAPG